MSEIDIILLCGGKGTRFTEVTKDTIPKSLFEFNKKPLIAHTIDGLDFSFISRLIFAVDYKSSQMESWINQQRYPCEVRISRQSKAGVLGAILDAQEHVTSSSFAVCNTDEIRENFSLKTVVEKHQLRIGSLATMATTYAPNAYRHRVINADDSDMILSTSLKDPYYRDHPDSVQLINTGFSIFDKASIGYFDPSRGNDWSSVIDPIVEGGKFQSAPRQDIKYFNIGTLMELEEAMKVTSKTT